VSANPIPFLRKVAKVEAISFLILLGVAMPLKYLAGIPLAVKICGWIHGILFVVFCAALLQTMVTARWSFSRAVPIFISALLPFGPFVLDRRMAAYEQEYAAGPSAPDR
jgi:integral membrane protein